MRSWSIENTQLLSSASESWSIRHEHPISQIADDEILVQTCFVGLNPFDWKGVKYGFGLKESPAVLGRDGSGIVVLAGSGVTRLKVKDKVWFCANPALPASGAFQEYSIHKASEVGLLPNSISLRSGATLGTGLLTAAVVLLKCFDLSIAQLQIRIQQTKGGPGAWIFIVSGSASTGQYLIQLSKLLGLRVICTASKSKHDLLKAMGADVVLDRHDSFEETIKHIDIETEGAGVLYAVDNVGPSTVHLCHRILDAKHAVTDAHFVALAGTPKQPYCGTRRISTVPISFSTTFFGCPEFSCSLLDAFHRFLTAQSLRPSLHDLAPGGLSGIESALLRLELGQVRSMRKTIIDVRRQYWSHGDQSKKGVAPAEHGVKRKATGDPEEQGVKKAICA